MQPCNGQIQGLPHNSSGAPLTAQAVQLNLGAPLTAQAVQLDLAKIRQKISGALTVTGNGRTARTCTKKEMSLFLNRYTAMRVCGAAVEAQYQPEFLLPTLDKRWLLAAN